MASHPNEAGTAAAVLAVSGTIATTIAGAYYAILDHNSAIGIGLTQAGFMALAILILFVVVKPKNLEVMK
jgi:hypothetical protein